MLSSFLSSLHTALLLIYNQTLPVFFAADIVKTQRRRLQAKKHPTSLRITRQITDQSQRSRQFLIHLFQIFGFPTRNFSFQAQKPPFHRRYGFALLTVAGFTGIHVLLNAYLAQAAPLLIFIFAVLLSAWYGGLGPGLLATILSTLIGAYFFIAPYYTFASISLGEDLGIVIFFTEGVLISVLNEALHFANRSLSSTLESVSDAFVAYDRKLRYTYVNKKAEQLLQKSQLELLGRGFLDVFPYLRDTLFHRKVLEAMGKQKPMLFEYYSSTLQSWFDNHIYPSPEGISIYFTDITKRKQAEEAMAKFAAIVTSSSDAIISRDLGGNITTWNKGAEKLYGYTAKEIIGKPISLTIPPDKIHEFVKRSVLKKRTRPIENFETERIRKDGKRINVSITVSPIRNASGRVIGASVIARDITERKELERRRDEFVSIASHELKTPITTIKAFAQIVARRLMQKGDKANAYFLENINEKTDNLTVLVNDLLDVSKIQAGKLIFDKKKFDFDAALKEVVIDFQYTTQTHQIINEGQTGKRIIGDEDRIGQVVINLLSNAIKYSHGKDKVIVRSTADKKNITVSVQDFGVGIPKEKLRKVFDRFYRVQEMETGGMGGFGLGLYISSEIIKRHHGKIWVESTQGKGSTFYFRLPLKNS